MTKHTSAGERVAVPTTHDDWVRFYLDHVDAALTPPYLSNAHVRYNSRKDELELSAPREVLWEVLERAFSRRRVRWVRMSVVPISTIMASDDKPIKYYEGILYLKL